MDVCFKAFCAASIPVPCALEGTDRVEVSDWKIARWSVTNILPTAVRPTPEFWLMVQCHTPWLSWSHVHCYSYSYGVPCLEMNACKGGMERGVSPSHVMDIKGWKTVTASFYPSTHLLLVCSSLRPLWPGNSNFICFSKLWLQGISSYTCSGIGVGGAPTTSYLCLPTMQLVM